MFSEDEGSGSRDRDEVGGGRVCSQELLHGDNKYQCVGCNAYQEAEKRVHIKTAPPVLIVHLNRLSYMADLGQAGKVRHRVEFGERLNPPNLIDGDGAPDVVYELFAVVVHVGSTSEHGAISVHCLFGCSFTFARDCSSS